MNYKSIKRWALEDGYTEGRGWPDWEPGKSASGVYLNDRHRTLRKWLQDVWYAMTGKTFVTLRITRGKEDNYIECHHDILFPLTSTGPWIANFDLMAFNDSHYYPLVRNR